MRILLTVHQFFPDFRAGTEVLTLSVARQLIKSGHEVHIFTGFPGAFDLKDDERFDEYEFEGFHIYRFHHAYVPMAGQHSMIEVGYRNVLAVGFFEKIINKFKPHLVHYFHLNRLGVELIEFAHQRNIPQFYTPTDFWMICATAQLMLGEGKYCSGPDKESGNCIKHFARDKMKGKIASLVEMTPTILFKKLAKITKNQPLIHYPMSNEVKALASRTDKNVSVLNKLDAIFVPNDFMEALFLRYGVGRNLLVKQPFGIELDFNNDHQDFNKKSSDIVFGFIGTLASHKGCHILIEAFKLLDIDNVFLEIYGNPSEFTDYYNKLHNSASDFKNISFKGVFDNKDINKVLKRFDALIVPSIWYENTPLVIYSAQAARVPVIGSKLPGIEAAIEDGFNGLLFEAGNTKDLSNQLRAYIQRVREGKGFSFIEPLSIEAYVNKLTDVWGTK